MKTVKKMLALLLALAVLMSVPVLAADAETEQTFSYLAYYYNNGSELTAIRSFAGNPSEAEARLMAQLYRPNRGADSVKLLRWNGNLEPMSDEMSLALDGDATFHIIHTNDVHGAMASSSGAVGIDKIAALKDILGNAILLDAGDATQGLSFATLSEGSDVVKMMNIAGYDAMVLGNHEFDYGQDTLAENIALAQFPVLSANVYCDGELLAEANTIITVGGVDVGIFGLTTNATLTSTSPANIVGLEFKDEIETAKAQVAELEAAGADIIIALAHLGDNEKVPCTSHALAEAMEGSGLDAIVDGHSHTLIDSEVSGIHIAQVGTGGSVVGDLAFTVTDGGIKISETQLTSNFFANIEPKAEAMETLNTILDEQKKITGEIVGKAANTLWSYSDGINESRVIETSMGDIVCDSLIAEAKVLLSESEYATLPIVAAVNGGGISATISNGDITRGDIINVLPHANTIQVLCVNPKTIYAALEQGVSGVISQDAETGMITSSYPGGFLQIGGMGFTYDPTAEKGSRVIEVFIDGSNEPLDRNDMTTPIAFATNDYVPTDTRYPGLSDAPVIAEGRNMDSILAEHIRAISIDGVLSYPISQGRINPVSAYVPAGYDAKVQIMQADAPLKDTDITYYLDGEKQSGTTDENGLLTVSVPTAGLHAIKLTEDGKEVHVNNYSGGGVVIGYYPVLTLH
ncbi:MAG: bifunctional metallophosphatase/5'-nucleotidase [Oscillospiraceae bacterium]|nr:bifunctional metallophosphatase/5'-nucleotidase [Oscillospiraceae bacterium]